MGKTYVIRWRSTVNGRAGRGAKLFEREEAERLAAELNQEYPEILHEALDTESESRMAPFPPAAEAEPERASPEPKPESHPDPSHVLSE